MIGQKHGTSYQKPDRSILFLEFLTEDRRSTSLASHFRPKGTISDLAQSLDEEKYPAFHPVNHRTKPLGRRDRRMFMFTVKNIMQFLEEVDTICHGSDEIGDMISRSLYYLLNLVSFAITPWGSAVNTHGYWLVGTYRAFGWLSYC